MGQAIPIALQLALLTVCGVSASRSLAPLMHAADGLRLSVDSEYQARLCGRLAATARNLEDAAHWFSRREPTLGVGAQRWVKATIRDLHESFEVTPDAGPVPCPARPTEGANVDSVSAAEAWPAVGAKLHHEFSPGDPADWPNWTLRLLAGE